jgi:hypothetical protein
MKKGEELERLVAAIERYLANHKSVRVTHNVKLKTKKGTYRQIDILIEHCDQRFPIITIIECKDRQSKVEVGEVNAFKSLLESVGAHQGIMVSKAGFQKGAIIEATNERILLYKLSEIDDAAEYIRTALISQYTYSIQSWETTIRFVSKEVINNEITIHTKLKNSRKMPEFSLAEIMRDFLRNNQNVITEKFSEGLTIQNGQIAVVDGNASSSINFNSEVYYEKDGLRTIIQGFDSRYKIVFQLTPAAVENVKGYKDISADSPAAYIVEVDVAGEKFSLLDKTLDSKFPGVSTQIIQG